MHLEDVIYNALCKMIAIDTSDVEMAHVEADGLLLEVFESMSVMADNPDIRCYANRLVQEYSNIPKWYA